MTRWASNYRLQSLRQSSRSRNRILFCLRSNVSSCGRRRRSFVCLTAFSAGIRLVRSCHGRSSRRPRKEFRFYGFIREYHEKDSPHCPVLDLPVAKTVIAVLDGQQRLTALNIGLRGYFAPRLKWGWWANQKSFPKTRLDLNVLGQATENELGMRYDFRMLRDPVSQPEDGSAYWFPISRLFDIEDISDLMEEVAKHDLGNNKIASKMLGGMWKAIHNAGALYFYEETDQDVEKVLDIFIRVNSGGTPLSYSDLLLSIATAQWKDRDAREEIHSLVDDLNARGQGFSAVMNRNLTGSASQRRPRLLLRSRALRENAHLCAAESAPPAPRC